MSRRIAQLVVMLLLAALLLPIASLAQTQISFCGQVWNESDGQGLVDAIVTVSRYQRQSSWERTNSQMPYVWQTVGQATISSADTGAYTICAPARTGRYRISVAAPDGSRFDYITLNGIRLAATSPKLYVTRDGGGGTRFGPVSFHYTYVTPKLPLTPEGWDTAYVYGQVYDPARDGHPDYADSPGDGIDGRRVELWRIWHDPQTRQPTQWDLVHAKLTNGGGYFIFAFYPRTPVCEYKYAVKVEMAGGGMATSELYPTAERTQILYQDGVGFVER